MGKDVQETLINRRLFLKLTGWGSFFIALAIAVMGSLRFFFPRVLFEETPVIELGSINDHNFDRDLIYDHD